MRPSSLDWVALPKFEFRSDYRLNNTLKAMGMPTPFSVDADLSGMTGQRNLFIKFVVHQAYIKVDEKGTEAAAATGGGSNLNSLGPFFQADHPFLFVIQENKTGNILFLGRVVNPNKGLSQ
jgi:serpin B